MCPRFVEDMPEDKDGKWVACAIKVNFCGRYETDAVEVDGLLNAYEIARWLALKLDWRIHPSLGVDWAVRSVTDSAP